MKEITTMETFFMELSKEFVAVSDLTAHICN
jgi:hypothetical protein